MGVLRSSSIFTTSRWPGTGLLGSSEGRVADLARWPGTGLLGSSEGRVADLGVFRAGRFGFGDFGDMVLIVGVGGSGFSIARERDFSIVDGIVTVDMERG